MSKGGHRVAIMTDSTCDLPQDAREQHSIHMIPLHIHWGDEIFQAGIDIDADTFYKRLIVDPVHPTTSQPSAGEFLQLIERLRSEGAEEIVGVFLSRLLSGTISSAEAALTMTDVPLHIVDTKSISLGVGAAVMAAVQARDAGGSAADIVTAAEKRAARTNAVITVDTLEYLHRGGRIGGAIKLVGHALSLKPVMHLVDGKLEPVSATRTRSKAITRMIEAASAGLDMAGPIGGGILHVAAPQDAEIVAGLFRERYAPQEMMTVEVTPVIGVHVGPNALGVIAYNL
jgi:DegV family protein with EDD domain